MSPVWHSVSSADLPAISPPLKAWVLDSGSMTARLKSVCNTFHVEVLFHDWVAIDSQDAVILNLDQSQKVIKREVLLYCDNQAWMYARTIFPESLVHALGDKIIHLSDRPLGELLFAHQQSRRGEFEISELNKGDPFFEESLRVSQQKAKHLWARRSVFSLPEGSLLLTEVFLPQFMHSIQKGK